MPSPSPVRALAHGRARRRRAALDRCPEPRPSRASVRSPTMAAVITARTVVTFRATVVSGRPGRFPSPSYSFPKTRSRVRVSFLGLGFFLIRSEIGILFILFLFLLSRFCTISRLGLGIRIGERNCFLFPESPSGFSLTSLGLGFIRTKTFLRSDGSSLGFNRTSADPFQLRSALDLFVFFLF